MRRASPIWLLFVFLLLLLLLGGGWYLNEHFFRRATWAEEPLPVTTGKSAPSAVRTVATPPASMSARKVAGLPTREGVPAGPNVADFYKNAFALLGSLTEEEKKILAHPREEVDADQAAALYEKIQPIMDWLRRALAEGAYCDWGVGEVRMDTPFPHIQAAMQLGKLGAWESAYRMGTDPSGGLEDLRATSALGHVVSDQALIGFLVGMSIGRTTQDVLGAQAGTFTPETLAAANEFVTSSSFAPDLAGAIAVESQAMQSAADAFSDPAKSADLAKLMAQMAEDPSALKGFTPEGMKNDLAWIRGVAEEFSSKALLPAAEFQAWLSGVEAASQGRPLAAMLLPSFQNVRNSLMVSEVSGAMLHAGLGMMQNQPLEAVLDPSTGQPFTYVQTASGFELRSPLLYKQKPVAIQFATGH